MKYGPRGEWRIRVISILSMVILENAWRDFAISPLEDATSFTDVSVLDDEWGR
jgi:hypothetical protein